MSPPRHVSSSECPEPCATTRAFRTLRNDRIRASRVRGRASTPMCPVGRADRSTGPRRRLPAFHRAPNATRSRVTRHVAHVHRAPRFRPPMPDKARGIHGTNTSIRRQMKRNIEWGEENFDETASPSAGHRAATCFRATGLGNFKAVLDARGSIMTLRSVLGRRNHQTQPRRPRRNGAETHPSLAPLRPAERSGHVQRACAGNSPIHTQPRCVIHFPQRSNSLRRNAAADRLVRATPPRSAPRPRTERDVRPPNNPKVSFCTPATEFQSAQVPRSVPRSPRPITSGDASPSRAGAATGV